VESPLSRVSRKEGGKEDDDERSRTTTRIERMMTTTTITTRDNGTRPVAATMAAILEVLLAKALAH